MPVEPSAAPASLPISALPRIGELIDGAQDILKADISRIKQLLVDPDAILPQPIVAFTLQEAKDALDLLAVHARQLAAWQKESISDAQRAEIVRLRTLIPHIRPLIQRLIALATALDRRAQGGGTWPRRKWRH
ncbi:MAG: hypothetical protein ACAH24_22235 [Hyphomicrobiaceae bacterium]|jgi:hypothetical protein